jgi:cytochrome c biogenesis protein ResB
MNIFKHITDFFFSLRTALWCLGLLLVMFFAGAIIMPGQQEFQALHSIPMFEWLKEQPLKITWWLWGLIGILAVLVVNTLFCSIESIVRKRKITQWLLLISPQIIHAGFLFMLIAHLMSAAGASQKLAAAAEGTQVGISNNTAIKITDINIRLDYYGYITDWEVAMEYLSDGNVLLKDKIRPNNPSVQMGFNINVKDLRAHPREAILLQINREPGALWALTGGVLFMVGIVTLILLRIKMEK